LLWLERYTVPLPLPTGLSSTPQALSRLSIEVTSGALK
jgi:hypothetical protein